MSARDRVTDVTQKEKRERCLSDRDQGAVALQKEKTMPQDFTEFLRAVSGMESSFGADKVAMAKGGLYGMTSAAGTSSPLELAAQNFATLTTNLGAPPTQFQQYLAWQQGAGGATKLLSADPSTRAADVVPIANLTGNIGKSSGLDPATMTVGDFLGYINTKWGAAGGTPDALAGKPGTGGTPAPAGGVSDWIGEYIARGAIIITGFIFVAVGLRGFRSDEPVVKIMNVPGPEPRRSREEISEAEEEREVTRMERKARRSFIEAGGTPYGMLPGSKTPAKRRTKKEVEDERLAKAADILKQRDIASKTITVKKSKKKT